MKNILRLTTFGSLSGLVWSAIIYYFVRNSNYVFSDLQVIFSSLITGIAVSHALKGLHKYSKIQCVMFSAPTLILAGFIFGTCLSIYNFYVYDSYKGPYTFKNFIIPPISFMLLWIWMFYIFIPLAILNLFVFRAFLLSKFYSDQIQQESAAINE